MGTARFEWPAWCDESPIWDHEIVRTLNYAECVHCGIVEHL